MKCKRISRKKICDKKIKLTINAEEEVKQRKINIKKINFYETNNICFTLEGMLRKKNSEKSCLLLQHLNNHFINFSLSAGP